MFIFLLGCGTGRISFPLANENYKITGIDFSQPMLNQFEEKLKKKSKKIQENIIFYQEDFRDFNLHEV